MQTIQEEATMLGVKATRVTVLLALFVGTALLIVMAPASAHATWTSADAHIADPNGTGYVSLLNVTVVNHALNDSATVTDVQLSDDGVSWYSMPYTGAPQDWVLYGDSGAKTLYVRFAAADGTLSPVVETHITVDTEGPVTRALHATAKAHGSRVAFCYAATDQMSPTVRADLIIKGARLHKTVALGWVRTGTHRVVTSIKLPRGHYRWWVRAVNLAFWAQQRKTSSSLIVKWGLSR
jgi:hypothetical protein